MKLTHRLYIPIVISLLMSAPLTMAQTINGELSCNWWGRDAYPLCEKLQTGWGREKGQKCVSKDTCVNGQPADRGGVVGGGSGGASSGSSSSSSSSASSSGGPKGGDQCNTTQQCQAVYGNKASDCLNSGSAKSICMCGTERCDGKKPPKTTPSPKKCTLNKAAPGLPKFSLFTPKRKRTLRKNFCDVKKWYDEGPSRQVFQLFKGDDFTTYNPNGRKHARAEAQTDGFVPKGKWHEFQADMKIEGNPVIGFTIAQIFGCRGPAMRVALLRDGRMKIGSVNDRDRAIGENKNYFNETFNLRVRTNGRLVEAFLNGKKEYSGRVRDTKCQAGKEPRFHFRWGIYSTGIPKGNPVNIVTNPKLRK